MQTRYRLKNLGGSQQLIINKASELAALAALPEIHWMSTSAPTKILNCNKAIIKLLDQKNLGRIFSDDLKFFAKYILNSYSDLKPFDLRSSEFHTSSLNPNIESNQNLISCANEVLVNLDKSPSDALTIDDLRNDKEILSGGARNGDGILPPSDLEDPVLAEAAKQIGSLYGYVDDSSGRPGINETTLRNFTNDVKTYLEWKDSNNDTEAILVSSEKTQRAWEAFQKVKTLIDDYFLLCETQKFTQAQQCKETTYSAPANTFRNRDAAKAYLEESPLAPLNSDQTLVFNDQINPAYAKDLYSFLENAAMPLLDNELREISKNQWQEIKNVFKSCSDWMSRKPDTPVYKLDDQFLRDFIDAKLEQQLLEIIKIDLQLGEKLKLRAKLEDLIILQQHFIDFCNNFVSFRDLYDPKKRAFFEAGTLIIDGSTFNFTIAVDDVNKHSKIASSSGLYLIYLKVNEGKTSRYICAPVCTLRNKLATTGKRGVLFDLKGQELDAEVVKIVDNPVSIVDAAFNPFRKLASLLGSAINKISSSTEKELEKTVSNSTSNVQKNLSAKTPQKTQTPAPNNAARDLMFTVAAIGSSFTYALSKIIEFGHAKIIQGIIVGIIIVLIPTLLISMYRLWTRNLSSIIEASGFAVNAPLRLTGKLSKTFSPKQTIDTKKFIVQGNKIQSTLNRRL